MKKPEKKAYLRDGLDNKRIALISFVQFFIVVFLRLYLPAVQIKGNPIYFSSDGPILTGNDPYLYTRYAKEILERKWNCYDKLRNFPSGVHLSKGENPPPISLLASFISRLTGFPLPFVVYLLPPFFASFLAIIIFLIGNSLETPNSGVVAGILACLSPVYVIRTGLGRFDTDFLNVTLLLLVSYLLFLSAKKKSLLYPILGGLTFWFFNLWWHGNGDMFFPLYLLTFFILLRLSRNQWGETLKKLAFFTIFYFINIFTLSLFVLITLFEKIRIIQDKRTLSLIYGSITIGIFLLFFPLPLFFSIVFSKLRLFMNHIVNFSSPPSHIISIGEDQKLPLLELMKLTTGLKIVGVLSMPALLFLFIKRYDFFTIFLPPILLSVLSINSVRFAIFLAPFLFFSLCYTIEKIKSLLPLILFLVIPFLGLKENTKVVPSLSTAEAEFFIDIKDLVEEKPIWTWWNIGYPLQYYAGGATFADGGTSDPRRIFLIAHSLAASDDSLLWKIPSAVIQRNGLRAYIYSARGKENRLKVQPQKFFLLFSLKLLRVYHWIHYFGTWRTNKPGEKIKELIFRKCERRQNSFDCGSVLIDLARRKVISKFSGKKVKIKKLIIRDGNGVKEETFYPDNDLYLEIVKTKIGWIGTVLKEKVFNSNFNKYFILRIYDKERWMLLKDNFPVSVLYESKIR